MTVTVETLAAALREALPDCNVFVNHQTVYIRPQEYLRNERISVFVLGGNGQASIEANALRGRYGRDMARAAFDVIDRLEDRDGA